MNRTPEEIDAYQRQGTKPEPNPILGAIGATIAAIISAYIWALHGFYREVDSSHISILVGFIVGAGTFALGRKSFLNGLFAAVFALIAVVGGEYLEIGYTLEDRAKKMKVLIGNIMSSEDYKDMSLASREISKIDADDDAELTEFLTQHPVFMAQDYTSTETTTAEITPQDLAGFREDGLQDCQEFVQKFPNEAAWRENAVNVVQATVTSRESKFGALKRSISRGIIIAFIATAVIVAFCIGFFGLEIPKDEENKVIVYGQPDQTAAPGESAVDATTNQISEGDPTNQAVDPEHPHQDNRP
jgi:phosphate/sulfate permease